MKSKRKRKFCCLPWLIVLFICLCFAGGDGLIGADVALGAQKGNAGISTTGGNNILPAPGEFRSVLNDAYEKYKDVTGGKNADYIPYLAKVDPNLFGIAIVTINGDVYEIGDSKFSFAIESISKVFTLCRVIQDLGARAVEDKIGLNATGLPFNSVMAVESHKGRTVNPFVNAGAMATVSLVKGDTADVRWNKIMGTMNGFSGCSLPVNEDVYRSESKTNTHNHAIALLLKSYGRFYNDPVETLDLYTRQCSVAVTARNLAVMGATLANGGSNPVTRKRVMDKRYVPKILALMMTNGLYEASGEWIYRTGLPGKSGVGGGILAIVPGKFAIAAFSPPLDEAGNSVRSWKAIEYVAERMKANLFHSP
ncbi:MAG: glutaminase A [Deltaproteobacteria bacterium]|nr:glutaminase A [Deltaproteobacteria bacterium]MBL6970849.1 glutaminase A [Desulfobacterales bacterium]